MQQLPEFPPLPQCFSHLVVSDGDPRSLRSHISASVSRISGRTDGSFVKTESLDDFDHYIMNGTRSSLTCMNHTSSDSDGHISAGSLSTSVKNQIALYNQRNVSSHQSSASTVGSDVGAEQKNPFLKLQTSLQKLQREMVSFKSHTLHGCGRQGETCLFAKKRSLSASWTVSVVYGQSKHSSWTVK